MDNEEESKEIIVKGNRKVVTDFYFNAYLHSSNTV